MRAIIFDLDNTIFDTDICKPYLRTNAGRDVISEHILSGKIVVSEKFKGIVNYINDLASDVVDLYVVSDSPKDYCVSILSVYKVSIKESNIFGSQHKPCGELAVNRELYEDILVIGDSPKDIYFAHINKLPSIMLNAIKDDRVEFYRYWTKPNEICRSLYELSSVISHFLTGGLTFLENDFHSMYITLDPSIAKIIEIPDGNIGHAFEYWPNTEDWEDVAIRKNVWFDVKRSIKVAKELTKKEIEFSSQVLFYNKNGEIGPGKAFKAIMWAYFQEFKRWIIDTGIEGKVYLVPAPASVPMECNASFPMNILAKWWRKYAYYDEQIKCSLVDLYAVERFWPTKPAHMSEGKREVTPHFETLGVYPEVNKITDAAALIIIDDVVTSGTQMNAVSSLLLGTGIFPVDVPLYGYALARTTRLGFSVSELLELLGESEKAGA